MKRSLRLNLAYFKRFRTVGRFIGIQKERLWNEYVNHLCYMETPNFYVERDLGYQTVAGQRVRCKKISDTGGATFFTVSDQFILPTI